MIQNFLNSTEFGRAVSPAARLALACFGVPPAFDDLMDWAALVRSGTPIAQVAAQVCAKPAFVNRYEGVADADFPARAYQDVLGRAATSTFIAAWRTKLADRSGTRADLMTALSEAASNDTRAKPQVDVLMTYAGMLRRSPDSAGFTYWVNRVRGGASVQQLIAQFFTSAEYRSRFM